MKSGKCVENLVKNSALALKNIFLFLRFRRLQLTADSRQSDLQKEINVKQFELERMQMILDETANNLRQAKLEAEKYQSKSEVCCCPLVSTLDCKRLYLFCPFPFLLAVCLIAVTTV